MLAMRPTVNQARAGAIQSSKSKLAAQSGGQEDSTENAASGTDASADGRKSATNTLALRAVTAK